jgi:Na+-translocating ferredoxin:NAD+ oxidoreductase RnfG subunit
MTPDTNSRSALIRKIFIYSGVLMGVCVASAAGISTLYVVNRDRINENKMKSFRQSLAVVLGEAQNARPLIQGQKEGEADIYVASLDGKVRYVVRGAARGYQSIVAVLASVDAPPQQPVPENPQIYRVAVVSSGETPGLGENINKVPKDISLWAAMIGRKGKDGPQRPSFQKQFSGKRLSDLRVDTSGEAGITPITGATITSRATTKAVRQAVRKLITQTRELYAQN